MKGFSTVIIAYFATDLSNFDDVTYIIFSMKSYGIRILI